MKRLILKWASLFLAAAPLYADESLSLTLKQAEELAIEHHYGIQASLHRLESGYYDYQVNKRYLYPSVNASIQSNIAKDHANKNITGVINLTQPLYDKVAQCAIKESQIQWEDLKLQVQQTVRDVLYQIRYAYRDMELQKKHLEIDERVIQFWQQVLQQQETENTLGHKKSWDIKATQLELRKAQKDFGMSQKKMVLSQKKLQAMLGVNAYVIQLNIEKDEPIPSLEIGEGLHADYQQKAVNAHPGLQQHRLNCLLKQAREKKIQAEAYPVVSAYANAGRGYLSNGFFGHQDVSIGVNVSCSLYDPTKNVRLKRVKEEINQEMCIFYQEKLEVEIETSRLIYEYEGAYQDYLFAKEKAEDAEGNIQSLLKKHEIETMPLDLYQEGIRKLHDRVVDLNQAIFDLWDAYYTLMRQVGIDLQKTG